jgi:hypothetical protein
MVNTLPTGRNQDVNDPEKRGDFNFSQAPETIPDEDRSPRSLTGVARELKPAATSREFEHGNQATERTAELTYIVRLSGDTVCSARTAALADASTVRLPR